MRIVFLGSGEFGVPCLDAVAGSRHELALVVTPPAAPAGRGRKPRPTPVAEWATGRRAPLCEANSVNCPEIAKRMADERPDLLLVIACRQKVCAELTHLPAKGAINVHASLLPKCRGAAPINWAIVRGESTTGVSIITLAEKIDAGDILAQVETEIGADETAGELHDRLARLAAPLLLGTLDRIEAGTATCAKQDESQATYAPKLEKADGFLDFSEPADVLARKIRGSWPWPGACAEYVSGAVGKSARVTLALARVVGGAEKPAAAPGTLDEDLHIVCGRDRLEIVKLKPAGSPLMSFHAFVNGRHTRPGDRFIRVSDE